MKRNVFLILGALMLLSALAFVGCKQATDSVRGDAIIANVSGHVMDETGAAIKGAVITYDSADFSKAIKTVTTDSKGYYSVKDLKSGVYTLTYTPPGTTTAGVTTYANVARWYSIDVKSLAATALGSQVIKVSQDVYLPSNTGATLKGKLVQSNGTGNPVILASKSFKLMLPNNYLIPSYNTTTKAVDYADNIASTTDAAGAFSFTALPKIDWSGAEIKAQLSTGTLISSSTATVGSVNLPSSLNTGTFGVWDLDLTSVPLVLNYAATYPALALVSNTATDVYGNSKIQPVASPIVLTFNNTLVNQYANSTDNRLTLAGNDVAATVAISGTTLTVTPAANLVNNAVYALAYKVTDGKGTVSGTLNFTTAVDSTAITAVTDFALNYAPALQTKFNEGANSFDVSFTYNANYTYTYYYMQTTDTSWTSGGAVSPNPVGSTAFATLSTGRLVSGNTLSIKLRVMSKNNTAANSYSDSNVITVADTMAPNAPTVSNVSYTAATATLAGSDTVSVTLPNLGVGLGNEKMSLPTSTFTGTATTATIVWQLTTDGRTAYGIITIPANATIVGSNLSITVKDAAGNAYGSNPVVYSLP